MAPRDDTAASRLPGLVDRLDEELRESLHAPLYLDYWRQAPAVAARFDDGTDSHVVASLHPVMRELVASDARIDQPQARRHLREVV